MSTADRINREEARRARHLERIRDGRTRPDAARDGAQRPAWFSDRSLLPKRPPGVQR